MASFDVELKCDSIDTVERAGYSSGSYLEVRLGSVDEASIYDNLTVADVISYYGDELVEKIKADYGLVEEEE